MDIDLVVRAKQGDSEAFASLAAETYGRFHRVAFSILRDRELALDATQQAMLNAWKQLPSLRDPGRFEAWAYRLLVNACYAEGKRARRWLPSIAATEGVGLLAPDELTSVAHRDQLERGFRRLPLEQRAVVVLHHFADLPLEQVAESLGIPVGTARSRLHRAMHGLRAALEADSRPPSSPGAAAAAMEVSR
jgi:RNA polymerase sigma-70 factor (ECF subfamily)